MAAEKNFLIRSDDISLHELASAIKTLTETTQDPEDPSFQLLPCVYDFSGENGLLDQMNQSGNKYLLLQGEYHGSINEMIRLLPDHITIEDGGRPEGLPPELIAEIRQEYKSLDEMIYKLQQTEREQKGEKHMEKENTKEMVQENEKAAKNSPIQGEENQQGEKPERKVYLSLPPVPPKAFKTMTNNLKEAGAKFDSYNKAWYITPDMDFNKFKGFLGIPYEQVKERGARLRALEAEKKSAMNQEGKADNRDSIKDKLDKNKEAMEKNTPEEKEPDRSREEAR